MNDKMGHDPFNPLGPEPQASPQSGSQSPRRSGVPAQTAAADPFAGGARRASRLDAEVERLRKSPTPTLSQSTAGVPWMGIFSRTRDIIAANFNDLLDKADDPAKMIRMIILEMEETLVEVRASAARTIADQKEMHRHTVKLDRLQADWGEKAQLALSKDREDLARAALVEKKKAADMAEQLKAEIAVLDDALRAYEVDIEKLQTRLREARTRQGAIAARLESAENRVKLRTLLASERVDDAMARFDQLERRVDYAEGRADALSLADGSAKPSLADEIAALAGADKIDEELEEMKRALSAANEPKKED
ncbi:phage shock protein PspA [Novosphingobium sp.]|uniref:phage shock protein PspA n=1 Tax=Novosphingobium sp. TaxID=1874826 RepID=UPI00262DCD54|nr:phage shock protein PspA [Novosphingobium sp.]HNN56795.1 phage shock protein PspA [Novosphingobium sp.]